MIFEILLLIAVSILTWKLKSIEKDNKVLLPTVAKLINDVKALKCGELEKVHKILDLRDEIKLLLKRIEILEFKK